MSDRTQQFPAISHVLKPTIRSFRIVARHGAPWNIRYVSRSWAAAGGGIDASMVCAKVDFLSLGLVATCKSGLHVRQERAHVADAMQLVVEKMEGKGGGDAA